MDPDGIADDLAETPAVRYAVWESCHSGGSETSNASWPRET